MKGEQAMFENIEAVKRAVYGKVGKVIVGKEHVTELGIVTLLCGGHMLIDDVPGTGKTVFAKTFAGALSLSFKRVQCVPDMLPSDLMGVNIFDAKESEFRFVKGPVFTNILLADEINRAMPKAQAGLLECMEEKQVSVEGNTYLLEEPFMVIATENPVETKGTFELPEAELDRFLIKTSMGYPTHDESVEILKRKLSVVKSMEDETCEAVDRECLVRAKRELENVSVHEDILSYGAEICEATAHGKDVALGVSPRGMIALIMVARAMAALDRRDYVLPDDIKKAAIPTLAHRIVFNNSFFGRKTRGEELVESILNTVEVPSEEIDFSCRG